MNGDGKLDIVGVGAFENSGNLPQKLFIALGNGDGTFKAPLRSPLAFSISS
jgi:hypothetical protein